MKWKSSDFFTLEQRMIIMLFLFGFLVGYFVGVAIALNSAHGDDNEDEVGLCLRGYETHCETWQEKMLKKLQEWNIMKAVNETLPLADRFEDMELGDPDENDSGMEKEGFCEGNLTAMDREFCNGYK